MADYSQVASMFMGDPGAAPTGNKTVRIYIFTPNGDASQYDFLGDPFLPITIAPDNAEYANIQLLSILSVDSDTCPFYSPIHKEQLFNETNAKQSQVENSLTFFIPADHSDAQNVVEGNLVGFKDRDGNLQLFEILTPEDFHADTLYRKITAMHVAQAELGDEKVSHLAITNEAADVALAQLLDGTRWRVGQVDNLGTGSISIDQASVLNGLAGFLGVWGGEYQFRVEMTGNYISGMYIDWLQQRGSLTGKRFVYGKDISSVHRTIDTSNLKTALVGVGKSDSNGTPLSFTDVEWSTANGDPANKPAGQDWIGDPTALAQWGRAGGTRHRFGFYNDSSETNASALLMSTWLALESVSQPLYSYQMNVVDLEALTGWSHEKTRIGDTVAAIDSYLSPQLRDTARVMEVAGDLIDDLNTQIVLGNFLPSVVNTDTQVSNLQSQVTNIQGNAIQVSDPLNASKLQGTIDLLKAALENDQAFVYTDPVHGIIVLDKAINNNPTKAVKIGGGIIGIANSKLADGSWDFKTFGTGDGFVADLINAGTLIGVAIMLGGKNNGNGQFTLEDNQGNVIITMDNTGIKLSNGATMVGGSGVLSELIFVSSGANQGWQNCGWYEYSSAVNTMALQFVYLPSNFTVESATLYSKHLPYYENDTIQKWWYLTNGQLMFGSDADNAFYNGITDSYVQVNNMTDITAATWGSYWNPSGTIVEVKSCDVTQYLTPGKRVAFGVNSHDSGVTTSGQISGMMQFELVVTGYKN